MENIVIVERSGARMKEQVAMQDSITMQQRAKLLLLKLRTSSDSCSCSDSCSGSDSRSDGARLSDYCAWEDVELVPMGAMDTVVKRLEAELRYREGMGEGYFTTLTAQAKLAAYQRALQELALVLEQEYCQQLAAESPDGMIPEGEDFSGCMMCWAEFHGRFNAQVRKVLQEAGKGGQENG